MQEFDGNACPNCLDVMDSNATQLRPIWSDYYDDVVCLSCVEEYVSNLIGATCLIRWNDASKETAEVYISCEDYDEHNEATTSGIPDDKVFFYANDPDSIRAMVDPDETKTDWTILSIESWRELKTNA
jgi:hypothetical protein